MKTHYRFPELAILMVMRDIESRADIDLVLRDFYTQAMADELIGHFFTEVAKLDLESHLPVIGDFWDSIVFGTGIYQRHQRYPMAIHLHLHRESEMRPEHFDRWLAIFESTLSANFDGPRATGMLQRAQAIGARFQAGISQMSMNLQL